MTNTPWDHLNEDFETPEDTPEEFEDWFTNLPTEEQKAYIARLEVLSEPREYRG